MSDIIYNFTTLFKLSLAGPVPYLSTFPYEADRFQGAPKIYGVI